MRQYKAKYRYVTADGHRNTIIWIYDAPVGQEVNLADSVIMDQVSNHVRSVEGPGHVIECISVDSVYSGIIARIRSSKPVDIDRVPKSLV